MVDYSTKDSEVEAEKSLYAIMIYHALHDLLKHEFRREAFLWIKYKGPKYNDLLTFEECCDVLEWSAESIREKAIALYEWVKGEENGISEPRNFTLMEGGIEYGLQRRPRQWKMGQD